MSGDTLGMWLMGSANILLVLLGIAVYWVARRKPELPTQEITSAVSSAIGPMRGEARDDASALRKELADSSLQQRDALERKIADLTKSNADQFKELREIQSKQLDDFGRLMSERLKAMASEQSELKQALSNQGEALVEKLDKKQAGIQAQLDQKLKELREDNGRKLDEMRKTVDEKLESTLEKRLGESFKQVSERLESVHQGLGEMRDLAGNVGDLKRTLTNVKTRGTWAEVQLGILIEDILTQDQYIQNAQIKRNSQERVEFAIKLPGKDDDGAPLLIAIDSKFPTEDYDRLLKATEAGDPIQVENAAKALEKSIISFAKDISSKYISPPDTTDFAIMYLPTEGLYAEILRRPGLAARLQNEHRVTVTGPTTISAYLTSLQMGFRTLAIEKRSSEVWQVLGAVKTEFDNFGGVIGKVKKKLQEAGNQLDQVDVRTRAVNRKLRGVEALPEDETVKLLGKPEPIEMEHDDDPS